MSTKAQWRQLAEIADTWEAPATFFWRDASDSQRSELRACGWAGQLNDGHWPVLLCLLLAEQSK